MPSDARDDEDPPDKGLPDLGPLLDEAFGLLVPDRRRDPRLRGRGEPPGYTPYVALDHDDPVAPTGVFYLSPDIWVVSSRGINLPVQGEANQVFARVHNLGLMDAVNVNVRFHWADPSAAITDQSAHPIGGSLAAATQGGVFIQAAAGPGLDSSVVVACPSPWVPAQATHECLLVKAWCPGLDPTGTPVEPVLDPASDRHSAQHNVTVEMVPPGGAFAIEVEVANIGGFPQALRLLVRALDLRQATARLRSLRIPLRHDPIEPARGLPLEVRLSEERGFVHRGQAALARRLAAEEGVAKGAWDARSAGAEGRTTLVDMTTEPFAPWERRRLALRVEVPGWARPGEVFGFEVTEYLGEMPTGGYVALIVVSER